MTTKKQKTTLIRQQTRSEARATRRKYLGNYKAIPALADYNAYLKHLREAERIDKP